MGAEKMTSAQMQTLIADWYDKPTMPHTPADVAAASGEGEGS